MNNKIDLTKMNEELTSMLWVTEKVNQLVNASMTLQRITYSKTKKSFQDVKYGWLRSIANPDYERMDKEFEEALVEYNTAKQELANVIDFSSL